MPIEGFQEDSKSDLSGPWYPTTDLNVFVAVTKQNLVGGEIWFWSVE